MTIANDNVLDDDGWDPVQCRIWQNGYNNICSVLKDYGKEEYCGHADYFVVEDNYGHLRWLVSIQRLHMLDPRIVVALRTLLNDLPDWEIILIVDVPGEEKTWPKMGLTIRKREIIDGLQRRFLPDEFRFFKYPDSRVGTGYD